MPSALQVGRRHRRFVLLLWRWYRRRQSEHISVKKCGILANSVVPIQVLLTSASRAARIAGVSVRTCRARLTLSDSTLLLLPPVGAATEVGAAVVMVHNQDADFFVGGMRTSTLSSENSNHPHCLSEHQAKMARIAIGW